LLLTFYQTGWQLKLTVWQIVAAAVLYVDTIRKKTFREVHCQFKHTVSPGRAVAA